MAKEELRKLNKELSTILIKYKRTDFMIKQLYQTQDKTKTNVTSIVNLDNLKATLNSKI